MIALGVECEEDIYKVCCRNIDTAQSLGFAHHSMVLHDKSETFSSFHPVRLFIGYDGGSQTFVNSHKGRIHLSIMRMAFCSPSVDVVVSSRLNLRSFTRYFEKHIHKLRGSLWKCLFIPCLSFGSCKYNVNVWFRLTPMQHATSFIDPRIAGRQSIGCYFICARSVGEC